MFCCCCYHCLSVSLAYIYIYYIYVIYIKVLNTQTVHFTSINARINIMISYEYLISWLNEILMVSNHSHNICPLSSCCVLQYYNFGLRMIHKIVVVTCSRRVRPTFNWASPEFSVGQIIMSCIWGLWSF